MRCRRVSRTEVLTLVAVAVLAGGCGSAETAPEPPPEVLLDRAFADGFRDFRAPEPARVLESSVRREFPGASLDAVWGANLRLLMQAGVVVRAARDQGLIVSLSGPPRDAVEMDRLLDRGLPSVVLVSASPAAVTVDVNWLDEVYSRTDQPDTKTFAISLARKQTLADRYFGMLEEELGPEARWPYLFQ